MRKLLTFAALCSALIFTSTFPSFAEEKQSLTPTSSTPISSASWSFECQYGHVCGTTGQWITTTSQPGAVRLWDSGTSWSILQPSSNTYDWTNLDTWLDLIAEHQPTTAMFTFGHVPCWATNGQQCSNYGWDNWSSNPPTDLTASGSHSFNAFITQMVSHCSPAGHCVKDYIKYWEGWNEANLSHYWNGTQLQLYQLTKPAMAIIRGAIPGAIVSTPPACGGDVPWMTSWVQLENSNGRISDYYGFHVYLMDLPPETRINMVGRMVDVKNNNGWSSAPWMNTETNFVTATDECSSQYSTEDCRGQLVRWHVLQYAYQGGPGGAFLIGWYNWPSINSSIDYDPYYYTMMDWLVGGTFKTSCTTTQKNGTLYTCPMTEANGTSALIVWNTSGNVQYTPASEYVDYKEMNGTYGGTKVHISPGEKTTVGVIPVMFEN